MKIKLAPRFADFCRFAQKQLLSGDIDPAYLVLARHHRASNAEQILWHLACYVAYYHLGSAERALTWWPTFEAFDARLAEPLPTGVERRGFRGNTLAATFLQSYVDAVMPYGSQESWAHRQCKPFGEHGWHAFRVRAQQTIRYCGPWASYKWADLLKHVAGLMITADDIGVGGGSETAGPVAGLVSLTGLDARVCATDTVMQRFVMQAAQDRGVPFHGLDQFETALCDWNSLINQRYYVGHDIDQMMGQLAPTSPLWAARRDMFSPEYLGEVGGWHGVRVDLKKRYATTGAI